MLLSIRLVSATAAVAAAAGAALPVAAPGTSPALAGRPLPELAGSPAFGMHFPGGTGHSASITGIVLGAGDRPLRGACVTARSAGGASALNIPAASATGVTGADGGYVLSGLGPGAYIISYRDCSESGAYFDQWSGRAALPSDAQPVLVGRATQIRLAAVRLRPVRQAAFIASSAARWRHVAMARRRLPSISGTVRDKAGKRLAGICVFVYPKGNYYAGVGQSTRRDGSYTFTGLLRPGRYLVQFTSGCKNLGNYAPQYWRHAAGPGRATVVRLHAGQHVTGINARLGPGGQLSGTVRAAGTGTPLAGVCVYVTSVKPDGLYQLGAVTAADGRYSLMAMATGRYRLQFQPDCGNTGNYLPLFPRGTVHVTAGKRTTGAGASLPPGAEIRGTVTGPGARPLAGICVYDNGNVPVAHTRADGSYSITRLGPGPNTLAFEGGCGNSGSYAPQYYPGQANPAAGIPVGLSAGQVRTGLDATMSPGGTVTGVVTSTAGQGVRGACVEVMPPSALEPNNQNLFIALNLEIPFFSTARTHAGVYRIANLAPGLYYAVFGSCGGVRYPPQWFEHQGAFGRASRISVGAGATTAGVDAVLPTGGTISGVLTDPAGRRLSGVCVSAYNVAGQDWMTIRQARSRRGAYQITGLAPGRYAVLFGGCALHSAVATRWFPAAADERSARPVLVRSGHDTTGINGSLGPGGSVSGRVISAVTGEPARTCGFVAAMDSAGTFMGGAIVGGDGRYRIGHLVAGRYTLQACGFGLVNKANVAVKGTRPTTGVTIVLPDSGSLAGQAFDSAGTTPEVGVCVTAFPVSGPGVVAVAATNRAGRWKLTGMDPGSYRVLFSPVCMAGFPQVAPQWFNSKPGARSATVVHVEADQTTVGVNARLPAPGAISGAVSNRAHASVPGICVTALPAAVGSVPVSAVTAANGRFSMAGLAPGKYLVRFGPGCGATGYLTQWYAGAPTRSAATAVTVVAGQVSAHIDAAVHR
jgi:hypothetical protein